MRLGWDPAKAARNRQERGFGFDVAALIFDGGMIEWSDHRHDYNEIPIRAIGEAEGLILHLVYTDRGDVRRIISTRMADRMERELWHKSR